MAESDLERSLRNERRLIRQCLDGPSAPSDEHPQDDPHFEQGHATADARARPGTKGQVRVFWNTVRNGAAVHESCWIKCFGLSPEAGITVQKKGRKQEPRTLDRQSC